MGDTTSDDGSYRILIATPKDYPVIWNGCEHARARHYPAHGCSVSVVYPKPNGSSRLLDVLRDASSLRWRLDGSGEVPVLAVDPWMNLVGGIARRENQKRENQENTSPLEPSANKSDSTARDLPKPMAGESRRDWLSRLRSFAIRSLAPLNVLRWVAQPIGLAWAVVRAYRGTFNVCVGSGPWGSAVAYLLRKVGKVRLFLYLDRDFEPGLEKNAGKLALTRWLESFLIRRADVVVSVGYRLAELRRQQTGRMPQVLPNGVDYGRFEGARNRAASPKELVYSGHVTDWAGLETILDALVVVRQQHPDVRFRVVGGGEEEYLSSLVRRAERLGLTGVVEFLGSQPNERLPALIGSAAIGLANSVPTEYRRYACPLKVMEYMAASLAVLVTEDTEAADIVAQAGAGVACSFDAESIAGAVCALFEEPERLHAMQRQGVTYTSELTWDQIVSRELALIEGCLAATAGLDSSGLPSDEGSSARQSPRGPRRERSSEHA